MSPTENNKFSISYGSGMVSGVVARDNYVTISLLATGGDEFNNEVNIGQVNVETLPLALSTWTVSAGLLSLEYHLVIIAILPY